MIISILKNAKIIFWDFDGVLKESNAIKSEGFKKLFLDFGDDFSRRVLAHHQENQGISRREKIALYLSWTNLNFSERLLNEYCLKFSNIVFKSVVEAPWVPGVHEYIIRNFKLQKHVIVSATPENELRMILRQLNFESYFGSVYGYPPDKSSAIRRSLHEMGFKASEAVFIGDAEADLLAANENKVKFILRRTASESIFQKTYEGLSFSDLPMNK